jgi:hypothetical protein
MQTYFTPALLPPRFASSLLNHDHSLESLQAFSLLRIRETRGKMASPPTSRSPASTFRSPLPPEAPKESAVSRVRSSIQFGERTDQTNNSIAPYCSINVYLLPPLPRSHRLEESLFTNTFSLAFSTSALHDSWAGKSFPALYYLEAYSIFSIFIYTIAEFANERKW